MPYTYADMLRSGAMYTAQRGVNRGDNNDVILSSLNHEFPGSSIGDRSSVIALTVAASAAAYLISQLSESDSVSSIDIPISPVATPGEIDLQAVISFRDPSTGASLRKPITVTFPPDSLGSFVQDLIDRLRDRWIQDGESPKLADRIAKLETKLQQLYLATRGPSE